jgi:lipoyl(octanoyl) transferase
MRLTESRHLHLVTYENGMAMQEALVALRQQEAIPDQLLLLQHTPVITLGRGGKIENLLTDQSGLLQSGVRFFETTRGGDITYHGPGQLVGYPILHLGEGNRDIRKYVWKIEEVMIRTAAEFGVEAERWEGNRGVWVGRE